MKDLNLKEIRYPIRILQHSLVKIRLYSSAVEHLLRKQVTGAQLPLEANINRKVFKLGMRRGQATLELIIGYSMAFMVIAIALALLFLLYPQVFSTTPSSTYSGFQGLKIVGQGYLKSAGIYYLSFQNLLNENINVTNIFFLEGAINQSGFVCTTDYLPNLGSSECNLSISLVSPFSATVQIYYTPSNTSMHPHIQITGTVTG